MCDVIAFDADDTLWHSETMYVAVQGEFKKMLSAYQPEDAIAETLYQTEIRNLKSFGYGVKAFALSMIEAAITLSGGQIPARDIQRIIDLARSMLETPLELFDHVEDTLKALAASHRLMVITKGDLLDQETKLKRSLLADYFTYVEIVSDKTPEVYRAILERHRIAPERFVMVGNSLRSDILPVLAIGGRAVYIPYHLTWSHELSVEHDPAHDGYYEIEHLGLLPALIEEMCGG